MTQTSLPAPVVRPAPASHQRDALLVHCHHPAALDHWQADQQLRASGGRQPAPSQAVQAVRR